MQVLEKYFDTAFDAPDGIKKLRELILTLAMQGKFVSQDPNDQPARELLKEIEQEKQKLIKESKIKQIKPISKIKKNEIPYELPESWQWVRLSEIAEYNGRKNISPEFIDDDVWLLDLEDIEKTTSNLIYRAKYSERKSKSTKSTFVKGDVLYGKLRPYLDKVIVADQDGVCTTEIVPIVLYKKIDPYFLRYLLKRPAFLKFVDGLMYGVKMPRLGTQDAINSIHPIPPYQEQKRIVKKIDQLMTLCDELEKLKEQKEEKKLTVHKSAINQLLDRKDDNNSQKGWHFISNHFNALYIVKENVSELRSAILQLAMQGNLVPQDPNDQPASELLKEIEKEKKANKIKSLEPIKSEAIPYNLPNGWQWVYLNDFGVWKSGSTPSRTNSAYYGGDIPWVKSGEVKQGLIKNTKETITQKALDECSLGLNPIGSVLLAMYGANIGEVGILEVEATTNQAICACQTFSKINNQFLKFLIDSLKGYFISQGAGAAQPNISRVKIINSIVPLPPFNEQQRIVEKINQLMALCDDLEKQIENSSSKQTELLNAIISNLGK